MACTLSVCLFLYIFLSPSVQSGYVCGLWLCLFVVFSTYFIKFRYRMHVNTYMPSLGKIVDNMRRQLSYLAPAYSTVYEYFSPARSPTAANFLKPRNPARLPSAVPPQSIANRGGSAVGYQAACFVNRG